MEKIRIDVVGLAHWDVRDYWKEYALKAVGKRLTLQPQPENVITCATLEKVEWILL